MHIEFWQCYAEENAGASAGIQKRDWRTGWTGKPVRAMTTLYLIILISQLKFCFFSIIYSPKIFWYSPSGFWTERLRSFRFKFDCFWFGVIEHLFIYNSLCLIFKENPWLQRSWQISGKVTPLFFWKKMAAGTKKKNPFDQTININDFKLGSRLILWWILLPKCSPKWGWSICALKVLPPRYARWVTVVSIWWSFRSFGVKESVVPVQKSGTTFSYEWYTCMPAVHCWYFLHIMLSVIGIEVECGLEVYIYHIFWDINVLFWWSFRFFGL